MHKPRVMEYIQGYGYLWSDNSKVWQEDQVLPSGLPIGHTDYGIPWAYSASEIHVTTDGTGGYWVMDRLSSYHKHPWRNADNAERYASHIKGKVTL